MNIVFVEIQNFRKLKSCRVEIASQETVFVGANNSGKTSAIDAMILFLKKSRRKDIATTDFTLSNWSYINQIGIQWVHTDDDNMPDLTLEQWLSYLPIIDIWLNVNDGDIHHVIHLLPTLDWKPDQNSVCGLYLLQRILKSCKKNFAMLINWLAIPNQLLHQKINAIYPYGRNLCKIFWTERFIVILKLRRIS